MMNGQIISENEALQILRNDLKRRALERHAVELNKGNPQKRAELIAQLDREVQEELRRREKRARTVPLCH